MIGKPISRKSALETSWKTLETAELERWKPTLTADECCAPDIDMDDIVAWITKEAKRRLEADHCGPGGLQSRIHAVAMELDLMVGEEMRKIKLTSPEEAVTHGR